MEGARLITGHVKPADANSFALKGTRIDGSPCIVQLLMSDDAPLESLKTSLESLFARFAEEAAKPEPPLPQPDPIFSDPNIITKSYDAIFKDAKAAGVEPQTYLSEMKADGWEHMPHHAAMQRRKP